MFVTPAKVPAPAATAVRGTVKTLRAAGIDLTKPVVYLGEDIKGPAAEGYRFERVEIDRRGSQGFFADEQFGFNGRFGLGGVATRFWLAQADEPVAEGDELDSLTFAELMVIAKALKVPGRGTARIAALRAGIRAARAAA